VRTPKQYWRQISARIKNAFTPHDHPSPEPEELERGISALTSANQALDQIKALKTSLAETAARLETTRSQARALRDGMEEQARKFEASRSRTSTLLETMDKQIKALADENRLYQQTGRETQTELRGQGLRLGWTMMVAGIAVVLATVSAAILIWETQKNTGLLASMNKDMKHLLVSMDQHLNTTHQAVAETPAPAAVVSPNTTAADKAIAMDSAAAMTRHGVLLDEEDDASGNSASQGYLPGSSQDAVDTRRKNSRILSGIQKKTFFMEDTVDREMTSLPGGLNYRVVTPGRGRSPDITDRVVVNYLAVSPDGKVIDDTYSSGQPVTLRMSEVTPALQEALLTMGEGAEWEVHVPEQQPYKGTVPQRGMQGFEPGIYLIELVEVLEDYAPDQPMPPE
jgi:hypothetical protein